MGIASKLSLPLKFNKCSNFSNDDGFSAFVTGEDKQKNSDWDCFNAVTAVVDKHKQQYQ